MLDLCSPLETSQTRPLGSSSPVTTTKSQPASPLQICCAEKDCVGLIAAPEPLKNRTNKSTDESVHGVPYQQCNNQFASGIPTDAAMYSEA